MTVHSDMSPSRLQRILDCPGSFSLAQRAEREEVSEYADEGTRLHKTMEVLLRQDDPNITEADIKSALKQFFDDPTEYINPISDCLEYLDNITKTLFPDSYTTDIEKVVYLHKYHPLLENIYGTADVVIKTPTELHIVDWKFGKGVPVYADNNDQLYAYAAGAAAGAADTPKILSAYESIYIHVVQPRIENFDLVRLTPNDLLFWINDRLIPGVEQALLDDAPFCPGEKQCRWCPAKQICKARADYAIQIAQDVFKVHTNLANVDIEEISDVLARAPIYEDYIKDLRTYMQQYLSRGNEDKNFKLVAGRSTRKWRDERAAFEFLSSNFSPEDIFVNKLISPTQAEKLNKSLKRNDTFKDLVLKPEGNPTLVEVTDKRPALRFKSVEDVFKDALEH